MLNIISASAPVTVPAVLACIYSAPGLGKTSMVSTAEAPLLLEFDHGSHRTRFRCPRHEVTDWREVARLSADQLAPYSTIVVDTVGRALEYLARELCRTNRKNQMGSGGLSLQGYGALKSAFALWLGNLRSYGKDVVLLSHITEKDTEDGHFVRLDAMGSSANEIYKSADLMGQILIDRQGGQWLDFSPNPLSFRKDPTGLSAQQVPHFKDDRTFLARILEQVKEGLKQQSAAAEDEERAEAALEQFRKLAGPEDFNGALQKLRAEGAPVAVRKALGTAGKEQGLEFDRDALVFREAA
ncbi:MAG: ATP-binding protein [Acidobacteriota bacterium]